MIFIAHLIVQELFSYYFKSMGCFTDLPIFTFLLFDANIIWPVTDLTGSQGGTYEARLRSESDAVSALSLIKLSIFCSIKASSVHGFLRLTIC